MRRLPRSLVHLSLVAAFAGAALGGCSNTDDDDVADVAAELRELSGEALTEGQARCVAEGLLDAFGDEDFAHIIAAAQNRTEGDSSGDVRTEVIRIWSSCDAITTLIDRAPRAGAETTDDA